MRELTDGSAIVRHITFTDEAWCQNCGKHPVLEFRITSGGEVSHLPCPECGSVELTAHVIRLDWILDTPGKQLAAAILKELAYLLRSEGDPVWSISDSVRHK